MSRLDIYEFISILFFSRRTEYISARCERKTIYGMRLNIQAYRQDGQITLSPPIFRHSFSTTLHLISIWYARTRAHYMLQANRAADEI